MNLNEVIFSLNISTDVRKRGGIRMRQHSGRSDALADGERAAASLPRHQELHRGQARHGRRERKTGELQTVLLLE